MVNVSDLDVRVLDDLLERGLATVEQVGRHPLELGPGEPGVQVQRSVRGVRDVRKVDLRLHRLGEFDLGLLRRLPQPLQRHLVLGQVHAEAALEVLHQPVHDALVPVVATKVVVAAGRLDLDHPVADVQEGHVEGAATSPTRTSAFLANATTDGVVREPSALAMTVGSPPSRTATTELVVPRSIPTARAMSSPCSVCEVELSRLKLALGGASCQMT